MKSTTKTEYAPHGLTAQGKWRTLTSQRFTSAQLAEARLEEYKQDCKNLPNLYEPYQEYKVMKRTVVITISEWDEA